MHSFLLFPLPSDGRVCRGCEGRHVAPSHVPARAPLDHPAGRLLRRHRRDHPGLQHARCCHTTPRPLLGLRPRLQVKWSEQILTLKVLTMLLPCLGQVVTNQGRFCIKLAYYRKTLVILIRVSFPWVKYRKGAKLWQEPEFGTSKHFCKSPLKFTIWTNDF